MSAMPSGMYLLRITMKDGARYHEKIMKKESLAFLIMIWF
jgi:hypothetical protein